MKTTEQELLDILVELVAVKELKGELDRRKWRKEYTIARSPAEVCAVESMKAECKVREERVWREARLILANVEVVG